MPDDPKPPYRGHPDQNLGHVTYSQNGEDIFVLNLFKQLKQDKFSYLDLGAHHPTNISNTRLFYNLGLTGVNVEANPHLIDNFHWDRSRDKNICIGVGVKEGFQDFYQYDEYSGRNTFSLDEALSVFVKHGMKFTEKRSLPVKTLNQIVDEYCGGQFPEFLNCDLEGLDYDVLRTADFENSRPIVICVESRVDCIDSMTTMMYRQGYEPYARLGENVIFVLQSHHTSLLTYLGLSKPC